MSKKTVIQNTIVQTSDTPSSGNSNESPGIHTNGRWKLE